MDDLFKRWFHVGHLPRRFPSTLPVDSMGYIPRKNHWIRQEFNSHNFSFILGGGGEYWSRGKCWRVEAPCVITQTPGLFLEYGPAGRWTEWEEFYLIYHRDRIPVLERMGLIRRDTPVWGIKDVGAIRARLLELKAMGAGGPDERFADRVDRVCELMIVESLLGENTNPVAPEERAILAIRAHVNANLSERHDFRWLARRHGLSDSTFRRHWAALVGAPPARHAMRLRMEAACRLLVETRLKVGEIAERLGFSDPLYFSRRFRQETGVTAVQYRRNHQSPLSLATHPEGSQARDDASSHRKNASG